MRDLPLASAAILRHNGALAYHAAAHPNPNNKPDTEHSIITVIPHHVRPTSRDHPTAKPISGVVLLGRIHNFLTWINLRYHSNGIRISDMTAAVRQWTLSSSSERQKKYTHFAAEMDFLGLPLEHIGEIYQMSSMPAFPFPDSPNVAFGNFVKGLFQFQQSRPVWERVLQVPEVIHLLDILVPTDTPGPWFLSHHTTRPILPPLTPNEIGCFRVRYTPNSPRNPFVGYIADTTSDAYANYTLIGEDLARHKLDLWDMVSQKAPDARSARTAIQLHGFPIRAGRSNSNSDPIPQPQIGIRDPYGCAPVRFDNFCLPLHTPMTLQERNLWIQNAPEREQAQRDLRTLERMEAEGL